MKSPIYALIVVVAGAFSGTAHAQEKTVFQRLVGTWDFTSEALVAPGQPKVKASGQETVRALGNYWIVSDLKSEFQGTAFDAMMTLGGAPTAKTIKGTFVSSMSGEMVQYTGTILKDSIELVTEMPNVMKGGQKSKFKDVIALQGNDGKTMKSFVLEDSGKWVEFYSAVFKRRK